ncbi:MAG: hypothetical protein OXE40_04435 [Gammaproteobacteria bacterium]|nr:hypothetical protein [Gammaproteobacteria bacterium]
MRGATGNRQAFESPAGAVLPALRKGTAPLTGPGAGAAEKELRCRTVGVSSVGSGPAAVAARVVAEVVRMVSGVEADVREADDLLKKSRENLLNDEEWRLLSSLISSVRNTLWAFEDEWDDRLRRLGEEGVRSASDRQALNAAQSRLAVVRRTFNSDDMPWESTIRPIQTTLPVGQGTPMVVESRIVPGVALGSRLAGGYPAQRIADPDSSARYSHVSDLEQTVLTDANGEVLYSGLRHGYIEPRDLDCLRLASLGDRELRALIEELYVAELGWHAIDDSHRAGDIDGFLKDIRENRWQAAPYLQTIRHAAGYKMTKEVVAAALVADPGKLHRAIEGETVHLHLGVVSLSMSCDAESLESQRQAFDSWVGPVVRLQVNGPDGEPRTALATVDVPQFSLGHEEGYLFSDGSSELSAQDLLGSSSNRQLGGAAAARIRHIPALVAQLRLDLAGLDAQRLRTTRRPGAEPTGALQFGKRPTRITNEMYRLERAMHRLEITARTLEEAGQQVKSVWIDSEEQPVSDEVCRQVAARLALIACLMDWTPVSVCRSGSRFTGKLDAEVKFLAAVANGNGGHLPPIDPDGTDWGRVRSDFEPH